MVLDSTCSRFYQRLLNSCKAPGKELQHIKQFNPNCLTPLKTNSTEVKSILETLQIGKASSPDNIINNVLKTCSLELYYPLSKLLTYLNL